MMLGDGTARTQYLFDGILQNETPIILGFSLTYARTERRKITAMSRRSLRSQVIRSQVCRSQVENSLILIPTCDRMTFPPDDLRPVDLRSAAINPV
jgi:hypothetical protein